MPKRFMLLPHGALLARASARFDLARFSALLLLVLSGCAALNMKPPESAQRVSTAPVNGHAPSHTSRDQALTIGAAKVRDVKGTPIYPAGLTAYGRMPDQTHWDYQYQVRDGSSVLRGECAEQVGEVRYYGLGETLLDVSCRCFLGQRPVADLNVTGGAGKATLFGSPANTSARALPDQRFAVFGTRGAEGGKSSRDILGYRFQSGKNVGAIDVTKAARAYYGEGLSKDDQRVLTCLYAGLLLHRPRR